MSDNKEMFKIIMLITIDDVVNEMRNQIRHYTTIISELLNFLLLRNFHYTLRISDVLDVLYNVHEINSFF